MAIFHMTAKIVSRGKGQSAIAAAAYRSGERLIDEQTGEIKHYQARAQRIVFTGLFTPADAPSWAHDRNALWNHAERAEKRKDSQLAREFEVALPHELTDQQREWLVKDFVREQFTRKGYGADIAIHQPDKDSDARNHHAHILVTMRPVDAQGFSATKDRNLNSREQLQTWRQEWEHLANRHLERHGHAERIDHRSLEAQGIAREPTVHLGPAVAALDARGEPTDRMAELRAIMSRNDAIIIRDQERVAWSAYDRAAPNHRASEPPALTQALTTTPRATELDGVGAWDWRSGAMPKRRLKPEPVDDADRPEPATRNARLIERAIAEPDAGEVRAVLAASSFADEGAPPPREDRTDPHSEDMEREDDRATPSAAARGVSPDRALDALGGGVAKIAEKITDMFLDMAGSGDKRPMSDEKQQTQKETSGQAWAKAVERSKAGNAEREARAIGRMEHEKARGLNGGELEKARSPEGQRER